MSKERRHNREDDHWFHTYWRPAMGWQYLIVCLFDFLLGPVMHVMYAYYTKTPLIPWVPLTVQGGGLYHVAMGAVVGITSYSKSQERVAVFNNNPGYAVPQFQNGFNNAAHSPSQQSGVYTRGQAQPNNGQIPIDRDAQLAARNRIINPEPDPDPPR